MDRLMYAMPVNRMGKDAVSVPKEDDDDSLIIIIIIIIIINF